MLCIKFFTEDNRDRGGKIPDLALLYYHLPIKLLFICSDIGHSKLVIIHDEFLILPRLSLPHRKFDR
jgi:hypothetical protein